MAQRPHKGFTLIEVIVSIAVFLIIAMGIYSLITYVFKVVYRSRTQIIETEIADERTEIIRNLPYEQVGTVGGVPAGIIPQTESIVRNTMTFQITTTIRNADDPFDGTAGGSPNDTSPADYKLAEISVTCLSCNYTQVLPTVFTSRISPKGLEMASQNGSLFITVFDATGVPIPGATVRVTNSQVSPAIDITDVTNTDGQLQIVDTATSTQGYSITVAKSGYSTDYTSLSTEQNPNPIIPPATVISQTVTNISFSIDKVGSIPVATQNSVCAAAPNVGFQVTGSKRVGASPDVYKYNQSITTNGGGLYSMNNLEWDTYSFAINGTTYDVAGAIPTLPITLNPDSTQNLTFIVQPHSSNSLLLTVKDSAARLPLSGAEAALSNGQDSYTLITGQGYLRQTDWSGGGGQESYSDETRYFSQDGNIEANDPAGDLELKKIGHNYQWSGWLESSTIDFGASSNFTNLVWEPIAQPPQAGANPIKFQIATSASSSPSIWNYKGPDGTLATYYTTSNTNINSVHNGDRYLRYKAFLSTANQNFTPQLSEVAISFTSGCTPPGQAFFSGLSAAIYGLVITLPGYQTINTTVDVSGRTAAEILMSQ